VDWRRCNEFETLPDVQYDFERSRADGRTAAWKESAENAWLDKTSTAISMLPDLGIIVNLSFISAAAGFPK
jgi:hypothetical protein